MEPGHMWRLDPAPDAPIWVARGLLGEGGSGLSEAHASAWLAAYEQASKKRREVLRLMPSDEPAVEAAQAADDHVRMVREVFESARVGVVLVDPERQRLAASLLVQASGDHRLGRFKG